MTAKKRNVLKRRKDTSLRVTFIIVSLFLFFISGYVWLQTRTGFCANSISCIKDLAGKKEAVNEGFFMGKKVVAADLPDPTTSAPGNLRSVLGDSTPGNKQIYINLNNQRLYAYENNNLVYNYLVSTGKWNHTPTGEFKIWIWLRYTRMTGGSKAYGTYYNLPNVPYTMYFYNSVTPKTWGYSLHGAYWHNNFGHPMSHGCVNMVPEEAGKIFYWADSNTPIIIYGETPKE